MKACIVTCFISNEERVDFLYETLIDKGYEVDVYTTDFSHLDKRKRDNVDSKYNVIKTKEYRRNLSFARIRSHQIFAKDVFKKLDDNLDLLWLIVPANSLVKEAKKYKKSHPDLKLIIDVIDMWPESLPVDINKNLLPFKIWKSVRGNNIDCCDALVCECDMYKNILAKEYPYEIHTLYWAKDSEGVVFDDKLNDDILSLCYIGSINNIIDTDKMISLIKNINRKVEVHIIGDGENKDKLVDGLKQICKVEYYGQVFDEKMKQDIFRKCHAGINIYKDNLYIGLTTKCLDYLSHGLVLINNIKGDTWDMVDKYEIGVNVDNDMKIDVDKIIELSKKNKYICDFYNQHFSKKAFKEKASAIIDEVIS